MQITIASGCKSGYGPVDWGHISDPQTLVMKVCHGNSNPCTTRVRITCSNKIEAAGSSMNCKESNLQGITSITRYIIIEKSPLINENDQILVTTHTYKLWTSNPKVAKVPVFFQSDMIKGNQSFMRNYYKYKI